MMMNMLTLVMLTLVYVILYMLSLSLSHTHTHTLSQHTGQNVMASKGYIDGKSKHAVDMGKLYMY